MCPPPLRVKTTRLFAGIVSLPSHTRLALMLDALMNAFALALRVLGSAALQRSKISDTLDAQYGAPR